MGKFRGNNDKITESTSNSLNIIAYGTKIVGKITVESDFRLDGEVEGDVIGKSKVVIGEKGILKGKLTCENAEITGKITGNLDIKKTLTLRSTAILNGDIKVETLVVEPNAVFNGTCSMNSEKDISKTNLSSTQETIK